MNRILLALVAGLSLCVVLLWWQLDRKAEALGRASSDLNTATARADSLLNTLRLQRELTATAEELDRKHSEELTNANTELEEFRGRVGTGSQRLLIKASCPDTRVSDAAGTARVDDAEAAELHPAARQDYFALRGQLIRTEAALAGLQAYVSEVCQGVSP